MRIKHSKFILKNNHGDTILEVVIAITLIALLLSGALALTQKSLQSERSSQEHNEALTLAQSQIEEMRDYATTRLFPTNESFCMISQTNSITYQQSGTAKCIVDASDNPITSSTQQPQYSITITPPIAGGGNLYSVGVSWLDASGQGKDSVTLYYQIND